MRGYVCAEKKSTFKDHLRWPFLKLVIATILGGCLVGLNNVFLKYLIQLVQSDLGLDNNKNFKAVMLFLGYVARTIGVVIAICSMDSFGRHSTIYWAAIMLALGAGISLVFPWISTMMIGRFIVVAATGIIDMTIPVYVSEVAPYRVRGMAMTLELVPDAIGQVLGHCVKAAIKSVFGNWKFFVLVESIICLSYICVLFTVPETPRFLYRQAHLDMDVDKYEEAVDLVKSLCPLQDADVEMYSLQSGIEEEIEDSGYLADDRNQNPISIVCCAWRDEATRRALLTWLLCISLPQLCGFNVVVYLTSAFNKATEISQELSDLRRSILVCWLKMAGSAMGACLLDAYEISRKDVLQVSFVGMITAHGAIIVILHGKTELSFANASMVLGAFTLWEGSFYVGHVVAATITEEACPLRFRGVSAGAVLLNSVICNHIIIEFSIVILRTLNLAALFSALFLWNLILLGLVWWYVPKTSAMPLELCWMTIKDLKRSKGQLHTT